MTSIAKPQEVKKSTNRLISHLELDSKSILAKLMAQENITIEHSRQATTASFDLASRRLILPVWENMSGDEYDMLIGHEVGHALFTCSADSLFKAMNRIDHTRPDRAKTYLNIIEDVRIERLIQEKYPGLRQNFRRAYDSFWKRNFFRVADKDLKDLPFIDRVNIHFKMHDPVMYPVPFEDDEKPIVKMIADAQEWTDVVRCTECIYKMYEDRARRKQSEESVSDSSGQNGPVTINRNPNPQKNSKKVGSGLGGPTPGADDEKDEPAQQFDLDLDELDRGGLDDSEESSNDSSDSDLEDDESEAGGGDSDEEKNSTKTEDSKAAPQDNDQDTKKENSAPKPTRGAKSSQPASSGPKSVSDSSAKENAEPEESVTQKNLDANIEAEARKGTTVAGNIDYIEIGELKNLERNIFRFDNFWKHNDFKSKKDSPANLFSFDNWSTYGTLDGSTVPQFSSSAFRNKIRKDVLNLVQEFNLRKAADEYSRATVARTGVIDPNKLHSYQYNDDIFRRALQVKKGKSHGLVMVIDWSGSMTPIISDVLRQTLILCEFCRQVQIPFEVYLFTDSLRFSHNGTEYSVDPNEVFVPDSPYYPYAKKKDVPTTPPSSAARRNESDTTAASYDVGNENHLAVGHVTLCQLFKTVMTHQEYEMAFNAISQWYYAYSQEARTCYITKDGTITPFREVRKTRSYSTAGLTPFFRKCGVEFGGTPLDESILCSSSMVLDFKRKTGVQIVNLILLTDGESNSMGRIFYTNKGMKGSKQIESDLGRVVVFRDKVTRYQTVVDYSESIYGGRANLDRVTKGLLHLVRYRTQCNIIGIYLVNSRSISSYLGKFYPGDSAKIAEAKAKFKTEKYAEVNNAGYTSYFLVPADCLGDDILDQDEDSENESILSPKRTVTRFLKESAEEQHSRVFLGRFMDIVGKEFAGAKDISR